MTKMYLELFVTFTRNQVKMDTLSFFKRGDFKVSYLKFCKSLGKKVHFFNSLGTSKISNSLKLSIYINAVLLINFPEQFELFFYFKYSRSCKIL